jgi:ABC-type dipeptide/oligopeptide/nickel transport system permease component
MLRFIARRCLQAVVVLFGITAICFVILHLTGDPAALLLPESASQKDYQEIRARMGFDRPLPEQFVTYMGNAARLDFGTSYHQHRPAMAIVLDRMPATIELAIVAMLIALAVALPAGILSATHRNTAVDYGAMSSALVGQSMPNFWLGLMLMLVFSLWLDLLPTSGRLTYGIERQAATTFYLFEGLFRLDGTLFSDALKHVILPAVTAGLYSSARLTRLVRSSMLDVLSEDYVRTARAKGLSEWVVVNVHALKNAGIPLVTMCGIELGLLLGGTVVTETVFAWPGVGMLTIQALQNNDFPIIQAAVFLLAFIFVFVNLAVDLLYAWLDPRIRYG